MKEATNQAIHTFGWTSVGDSILQAVRNTRDMDLGNVAALLGALYEDEALRNISKQLATVLVETIGSKLNKRNNDIQSSAFPITVRVLFTEDGMEESCTLLASLVGKLNVQCLASIVNSLRKIDHLPMAGKLCSSFVIGLIRKSSPTGHNFPTVAKNVLDSGWKAVGPQLMTG